ncbi:MAG TPA: hypothetical protein VNR39_11165 [Pseudolabrys sp.]|nr:hypothetical protein [Pseudolabrys sp.]
MASVGTLEVANESAVAIYNAKTGEIVHRHEVLTLRGGTHPDPKTIEREAHAEFKAAQPSFKAEVATLHFDPAKLKPDALYKVNVKTGALVERAAPKKSKTR